MPKRLFYLRRYTGSGYPVRRTARTGALRLSSSRCAAHHQAAKSAQVIADYAEAGHEQAPYLSTGLFARLLRHDTHAGLKIQDAYTIRRPRHTVQTSLSVLFCCFNNDIFNINRRPARRQHSARHPSRWPEIRGNGLSICSRPYINLTIAVSGRQYRHLFQPESVPDLIAMPHHMAARITTCYAGAMLFQTGSHTSGMRPINDVDSLSRNRLRWLWPLKIARPFAE